MKHSKKKQAGGNEAWAHGRVVRQVTSDGEKCPIGFLLYRNGGGREPGWYVCLGWENYLPRMATALPETVELDRRKGVRVDGELRYAWAGHSQRTCSVDCPACTGNGGTTAAFTCRLVPGLQGVGPGAHQCVIDKESAGDLLSRWQLIQVAASKELSRATSELDRLTLLVGVLDELAGLAEEEA